MQETITEHYLLQKSYCVMRGLAPSIYNFSACSGNCMPKKTQQESLTALEKKGADRTKPAFLSALCD